MNVSTLNSLVQALPDLQNIAPTPDDQTTICSFSYPNLVQNTSRERLVSHGDLNPATCLRAGCSSAELLRLPRAADVVSGFFGNRAVIALTAVDGYAGVVARLPVRQCRFVSPLHAWRKYAANAG
jgi:hypothetical protein